MKHRPLKATLLFVLLLIASTAIQSSSAIAAIPTAFSYQGTLRLADGNLANGSFNLSLKIYKVVTGGTPLHSEDFANVVVRNGNFSVVVGDAKAIDPAVFNNTNLYLGISVAPDPELLPRQRLYPVPWAMQADQAKTATTATTLVKDATIDGLIINKGATNDGALKVTSSGPGWGSGIRFENSAANRTYGIYTGSDGIWRVVDETAFVTRIYIQTDGYVRIANLISDSAFLALGDIRTNGALKVDGDTELSGNTIVGGNIVATGKIYTTGGFNGYCRGSGPIDVRCDQDIAETFATDQRTEPGDLVVFIPEDREFTAVRLSSHPYAGAIVGVVSTSPGLVFDQGKTFLAGDNTNLITDKKTVVAMVGRVPTKFSLENGSIAVGDPLTSSSEPGVAMKATQAGHIIGYAMQSSDAAEDGKLLVWLQLGMYIPPATLDALNNLDSLNNLNGLSNEAFTAPSAANVTTGLATNSTTGTAPALTVAELQAQIDALSAQIAKLQVAQP